MVKIYKHIVLLKYPTPQAKFTGGRVSKALVISFWRSSRSFDRVYLQRLYINYPVESCEITVFHFCSILPNLRVTE